MPNWEVRKPVVAGQFYPSSAQELRLQISKFVGAETDKTKAVACLLPHAGYIYSGKVAALTLATVEIPATIILLGPNHTGSGAPFSIMREGIWQTPLGDIEINSRLADELLKDSSLLVHEPLAHLQEHSLEVQLPLLQYFRPDFNIVPIVVSSDDIREFNELGKEIAEAVINSALKDSVMIIASSDMTHYEPLASAKEKDKAAIEAILQLDGDKLMNKVKGLNISMCGYMPTIIAIAAAKQLGAKSARLIKYTTSAEITEDNSSVVGYAGIVIQ